MRRTSDAYAVFFLGGVFCNLKSGRGIKQIVVNNHVCTSKPFKRHHRYAGASLWIIFRTCQRAATTYLNLALTTHLHTPFTRRANNVCFRIVSFLFFYIVRGWWDIFRCFRGPKNVVWTRGVLSSTIWNDLCRLFDFLNKPYRTFIILNYKIIVVK